MLVVNLHSEKLPEGVYLTTSYEGQGLAAQGRRIQETIEIAHDVVNKLLETREESTMQGKKDENH